MNNGMPFIYPSNNLPFISEINHDTLNQIINKLEKIEQKIHILDDKLNKLENNSILNNNANNNPNDMYII